MNIDSISDTIQRALKSAGLDSKSRLVQSVEATIRSALNGASVTAKTKPSLDERIEPGRFTEQRFSNAAGSRQYKLYVPSSPARRPMPLIVMLHGCKQNPDDFAVGTRMNDLANKHGFVVAYPAQSANANGSNCWNWFSVKDQARDGGEADIIAGIALEVAGTQNIDRRRIFVAGLSAGGAMATILGVTHPDVFAGVGAHSGLPHGAAHDVASAFMAMRRGDSGAHASTRQPPAIHAHANRRGGVPTIVFHGDSDNTVSARNGWAIVDQARSAFAAEDTPLRMSVDEGTSRGGRAHTTTRFTDTDGHPRIEHWLLHRGAHAWSGGDPKGSFTARDGPDASAEMVRFFLAQ